MKNKLKVGFARVDVTPPMGISISGYYHERIANGVSDPIEANAVAISTGDKTVVLIVVDSCGLTMKTVAYFKDSIVEKTGIAREAIIISATHTHTAPCVNDNEGWGNKAVPEYRKFLCSRVTDAAMFAIDDLKPAKMGWKIGNAPNIAFIRRFKMKDGEVRTNPGVGNPDIVEPIGDVDERLNVLRFDREGADTVVIMNFGCHPDVVGGCKISGDWPAMARRTLERSLPGVKSMFINGAEGDVNHVDVKAKDGDYNDLANDFDDVARGYGHARHMGNVIAGTALQVFDKVNYVEADEIKYFEKTINVPSNRPKPEELPLAHKYKDLHEAGKDDEIPFSGMELTTVVAEALRMVKLENGPDSYEMSMTGISVGNVAFISIPGEAFTYVGRGLKEAPDWDIVLPLGLANGYEDYFPTKEAYDEGGYEARSSIFKSGVGELFVEEGKKILAELKK